MYLKVINQFSSVYFTEVGMTPHFTEAIKGITSEVDFKSCCDVLLNIPNNGPGGFSAIVKSCFIPKNPDTIEYCLNNIQSP